MYFLFLITIIFGFLFLLRSYRLAFFVFACGVFVYITFLLINCSIYGGAFEYQVYFFHVEFLNIFFVWNLDVMSLGFMWLTALLWVICILVVWTVKYKLNFLLGLLAFLNFFLFNVFAVSDLLFFYIFFEALLIPMFFLIGIGGSRERRVYAAYLFFIYTLIGSLFMLIALLFLYSHFGTLDSRLLYFYSVSDARQVVFWVTFFFSIAIKVPMFPVHIGLPEAHVEAPTVGSILLAGLLLKLGLFCLVKFLFPIFPFGSVVGAPLVLILALIGVLYASFSTLVQVDLKKLVAYSSVAHMNFVVLGLFSFDFTGLVGAISLMISHGLVSSALFFCVGVLYERYKTRLFLYYGGLYNFMPIFNLLFLFFVLSNMSFPGTFSFIGEFLILVGLGLKNLLLCLLSASTMIFSAAYSLLLYTQVMLGRINPSFIRYYNDVTKREFACLFILALFVLGFGICPNLMLEGLAVGTPFYLDFIWTLLLY